MKKIEPLQEIQDPDNLMSQLATLRKDKETSIQNYNALAQKKLQLETDLGKHDATIVALQNENNSLGNDNTIL